MVDDETLVRASWHGHGKLQQAVRHATVGAGKMRVALRFGAMVGQLEIEGSVLDECLVHQAGFQQSRQRTIDCRFVEMPAAESSCNLLLPEGF